MGDWRAPGSMAPRLLRREARPEKYNADDGNAGIMMEAVAVKLSAADQAMLNGEQGPADQMAMRILTRMADVRGAASMLSIEAAHIDSTLYMGQASLEFAERLQEFGARVSVPTTLNVGGVDLQNWQEWAVPPDWAQLAARQMRAYEGMGAVPTWTCAPYQTSYKPRFGQQIAWGESNAIVFANSVIGARTERYPDMLDICAAITARVPAIGLHLEENRRAELVLRLKGVPAGLQARDDFYPVFGHLAGKLAQERVVAVDGLEVEPDEDQLKAFGAAAASSGSVALFHITGVTPEAPILAAAGGTGVSVETIVVSMDDLRRARRELTTHSGEALDMVVLGSPHFSLAEFRDLAELIEGRRADPQVKFLVTSSRAMAALAEKSGSLASLRRFGGLVTLDTCILTTPMLPDSVKILMTNSAKYAYYSPGMLGTEIVFGSLSDCVESAVSGRVVRDESAWRS